jgi:rhodanese-related sulfurtransferase
MEKIKSNMLGYGIAAALVAIIIIAAIALNRTDLPYKLTAQQALDELKNKDNTIDPASNSLKADAQLVFIDVRNPLDYEFRHFGQAVNIPVEKILTDEYLESIREMEENDKTIVLYGTVPQQVAGAWLLLRQVGITGVKMFNGTFEQLMTESPVAANVYNEVPVIDTALLNKAKEPVKVAPKPSAPKKQVVPAKVQPEPESGGGC